MVLHYKKYFQFGNHFFYTPCEKICETFLSFHRIIEYGN